MSRYLKPQQLSSALAKDQEDKQPFKRYRWDHALSIAANRRGLRTPSNRSERFDWMKKFDWSCEASTSRIWPPTSSTVAPRHYGSSTSSAASIEAVIGTTAVRPCRSGLRKEERKQRALIGWSNHQIITIVEPGSISVKGAKVTTRDSRKPDRASPLPKSTTATSGPGRQQPDYLINELVAPTARPAG